MKKLFRFKELLAVIVVLITLFQKLKLPGIVIPTIDPHLLNIIVLLIGILLFSTLYNNYFLIERSHGEIKKEDWKDISTIQSILKLDQEKAIYFIERTSATIGQLVNNFSLFLWPLIIFYALDYVKSFYGYEMPEGFAHYSSLADYTRAFSFDHDNAFKYVLLSALINIFNFISAVGLFVSFSILYQKTLDANNKSILHLGVYYFLLIAYILSYIVLLGFGFIVKGIHMRETILCLDLFCSVFNGVGMILFFNRLVQILYFYQKPLAKGMVNGFYFWVAIVVLPLYACSQIFFALFDQLPSSHIKNYAESIKWAVFYICFIGKFFLILFLYSFVRTKWLHSVVLTLLVTEHLPFLLAEKVKVISNSIEKLDDDAREVQSLN